MRCGNQNKMDKTKTDDTRKHIPGWYRKHNNITVIILSESLRKYCTVLLKYWYIQALWLTSTGDARIEIYTWELFHNTTPEDLSLFTNVPMSGMCVDDNITDAFQKLIAVSTEHLGKAAFRNKVEIIFFVRVIANITYKIISETLR